MCLFISLKKNAHLSSVGGKGRMELSFDPKYAEVEEESCLICYDSLPPKSLYHFGCYHAFCVDCWQGYIDSKLDEIKEGGKLNIFCPGAGCNFFVRKEFILEHASDQAKEQWSKVIADNEIKPVSGLIQLFSSSQDGYDSKITSETDYFHYECLSEYDTGWGCAYRCLQMLLNNFKRKNIGSLTPTFQEPTIFEMQQKLAVLNTENYFNFSDIGGSRWIGGHEIAPYLREYGINSEVGDEIVIGEMAGETISRFWAHFRSVDPSPVIFDDGKKTKLICGVRKRCEDDDSQIEVLIFDPHHSENISYDDYVQFQNSSDDSFISVKSGDVEELERKKEMVRNSICWSPFSSVFTSEFYQVLWVKL